MAYERLNADGTWTEETAEEARERIFAECIARHGEEEGRKLAEDRWGTLNAPITPESEMTEGEQMLANRMQAEHGVNAAAARAGVASIFDLPSWDDDKSIPLDGLVPQEYDDEGAAADYEARKAREQGERHER